MNATMPQHVTKEDYLEKVTYLNGTQAPYYNGQPVIPDTTYDRLYRELKTIEKANPNWVVTWSPTQRVAERPSKAFHSAKHHTPMLSLDNVYDLRELVEEMKAVEAQLEHEQIPQGYLGWTIEPKVDGCSLELIYNAGVLVQAITRGDGITGDDVTSNARTIRNIPVQLCPDIKPFGSLVVRGEVVIFNKDFEAINTARETAGEAKLANPRNAATGALKAHDPKEASARQLRFIAYSLVSHSQDAPFVHNGWHHQHLHILKSLGFTVAHCIEENTIADAIMAVQRMEKWRKEQAPYWTDGVVIKLDQHDLRKLVGEGTKAPRWAWAAKLTTDTAQTHVTSVTMQVGKTGTVCPVAELAPVVINGTTVTRATLHNFDEVARLGICEGDKVDVVKAGEIIPSVTKVYPESRIAGKVYPPVVRPETCPCCNTPLEREANFDGKDSSYWYCPNHAGCAEQIKGRIQHWCSKKAADIEGCGPSMAATLVSELGVKDASDLYTLDQADLSKACGGMKIAGNFFAAIQDSKKRGLERVLYGLCIPYVGEGTAKRLANHFDSLEAIQKANIEEIAKVEDIGEGTARLIHDWMNTPENKQTVANLWNAGVDTGSKKTARTSNALEGKTFVITGELEYGEREAFKALLESHGGKVTGSVSKKTNYLIAGANTGRTKTEKAKACGTVVISEQEALAMLPAQ